MRASSLAIPVRALLALALASCALAQSAVVEAAGSAAGVERSLDGNALSMMRWGAWGPNPPQPTAAAGTAAAPPLSASTDHPALMTDDRGGEVEALVGRELLEGIRTIIASPGNLPYNQVQSKPFMGSFSTITSADDPHLASAAYCLTDRACGHFEAYSWKGVQLSKLGCNTFCYVDRQTRRYVASRTHTVANPPEHYLCCGWETCG